MKSMEAAFLIPAPDIFLPGQGPGPSPPKFSRDFPKSSSGVVPQGRSVGFLLAFCFLPAFV